MTSERLLNMSIDVLYLPTTFIPPKQISGYAPADIDWFVCCLSSCHAQCSFACDIWSYLSVFCLIEGLFIYSFFWAWNRLSTDNACTQQPRLVKLQFQWLRLSHSFIYSFIFWITTTSRLNRVLVAACHVFKKLCFYTVCFQSTTVV